MKKRLSAILLAVLLLVGLIPTSVFAAPSDDPLLNAIYLRNNDEGSISKNIGDTGLYQRLPRLTNTCRVCNRTVREFIPDDYFGCSYELSNPDVLSDCSITVDKWSGGNGYNGYPCFEFDYTAAKAGTTKVTLTFYYHNMMPPIKEAIAVGAEPISSAWQITTTITKPPLSPLT